MARDARDDNEEIVVIHRPLRGVDADDPDLRIPLELIEVADRGGNTQMGEQALNALILSSRDQNDLPTLFEGVNRAEVEAARQALAELQAAMAAELGERGTWQELIAPGSIRTALQQLDQAVADLAQPLAALEGASRGIDACIERRAELQALFDLLDSDLVELGASTQVEGTLTAANDVVLSSGDVLSGDGLLTGTHVLAIAARTRCSVSRLSELNRLPQVLLNVKVRRKPSGPQT